MTEEELGSKFNMKNVDFSVIRKALQASGKMVEQIIDGIHCGSTEIRHLILEESDIIIECKICRNLFRALPNFVAHKRMYCLDSFVSISKVPSTHHYPSSEDVVFVEPEPPDDAREFVKNLADSTSSDQSELNDADPKSRAKNNPDCGKTSQKSCRRKPSLLLLQKLTEIDSGEKSSSQKKDPIPAPPDSPNADNSIITGTGNFQSESVLKSQLADYRQLKCRKCNQKLSSRNSLSHHIVNLHAERKRFYSCPYCGKVKGKFRYIGGVVRHLGTAHNLKKFQIDKLRKKVKENSWFEDNLSDSNNPEQPAFTEADEDDDSNEKKTNREDPHQLKWKIKILSDSDTNKEPSYEMVRNDEQDSSDENVVESPEKDKSVELPPLEGVTPEVSSTPLPVANEVELEKEPKSENQALEHSDLSDEVASEISEKDGIPEEESEMEVSQIAETTDCGNRLFPTSPSVKLSPLPLSECASEPTSDPCTSHPDVEPTLSADSSFEGFSEQDLEESCKSEIAMRQRQQVSSVEVSSASSEEEEKEEKPEFTPRKTSPSKLDKDQSVTSESPKAESSLSSSPFHSDTSSVLKPRSARSRMKFVCEHCKKCFGQKKTLDEHARLCSDWIHQPKPSLISESQKPKVVPALEIKKEKKDFKIEPKKAIRRSPEKPADSKQTQSLKTNCLDSLADKYDKEKVLAMIDGKALKCLDCNQKFSNQSHLRRHAVRHLGWRRFKCKLCSFTSYDKSETKTHIKRCHLGKTHGLTTKSVDYYIADLKAENSRSKKSLSSSKTSDKSRSSKSHSAKKSDSSPENINGTKCKASSSDSQSSEKKLCLRISPIHSKTIRTSPRKPVPKIDKMSSLFIKKY